MNQINKMDSLSPTDLRDLGGGYVNAFVTFIDILGFKNMINEESSEFINEILSTMQISSTQSQLRRPPYNKTENLPMIFQFSDSIIRIQPYDELVENINILDLFIGEIIALLLFQGELACDGIIVRGGLTFGEVCVHKNRIFGPALIQAYNIESSLARYPRIVVDELLIIHSNKNPIIQQASHDQWQNASYHILEYLERADDGQWGIHYLPHIQEALRNDGNLKVEILTLHKEKITQLLTSAQKSNSPENLAKIRWLANYHNRTIQTHFKKINDHYENMHKSLFIELD